MKLDQNYHYYLAESGETFNKAKKYEEDYWFAHELALEKNNQFKDKHKATAAFGHGIFSKIKGVELNEDALGWRYCQKHHCYVPALRTPEGKAIQAEIDSIYESLVRPPDVESVTGPTKAKMHCGNDERGLFIRTFRAHVIPSKCGRFVIIMPKDRDWTPPSDVRQMTLDEVDKIEDKE